MRMEAVLLIAVGGAIGSVLRAAIGYRASCLQVEVAFFSRDFPWGTVIVNLLGSFLIGCIAGYLLQRTETSPLVRDFLIIGALGGFTTFSSFSYDTIILLRSGIIAEAFLYVTMQVLGGLFLAACGLYLSKLAFS